ncbi:MAG: acyl-CoA thioesterase [Bacteroidetes bacterium]|nr:MAG: acyl-CoA thioesterase [Bacteroidota bacterium]
MSKQLIDRKEITIRFSEVDSMAIVWHGNYVKYLEEGRESFGNRFGISYLDIYANKMMAPVVNMDISFKRQVKYGETIIVETKYIDQKAAKLVFNYRIYRKENNELVATATTTQVFIDLNYEMLLYPPEFALEWKRKMGLLEA